MAEIPKANILVVDDHQDNLLAMQAVLEDLGENLILVDSGRKALRQMLDNEIALLLLDVNMPNMDGFEVATLTRQTKKLQHIPIIFLTAFNQNEQSVFKGYSLGAVDYIYKPFEPEILKSKVKVFIDLYRKSAVLKEQAHLLEEQNQKLDRLNAELERRILERTAQLQAANEELKREIEERKRAQAEAEAANCLKDEFLTTISHELRTPLAAIMGWIGLLRQRKLNEEMTAQAIETIDRNAKAQARLINDLLDVSRYITGKMRLEVQPVDIEKVLYEAVETVRLTAAAKGVDLIVTVERPLNRLLGDHSRLKQIVWNLLSNAIKFTPEGRRVEIRLAQVGDNCQISVHDEGQGISAQFLPYVFDRFRQADGSITRKFGGLGLGLAIVRHLVELHGGTVSAQSEGEGKGATFTVSLPAKAAEYYQSLDMAVPANEAAESSANQRDQSTDDLLSGLRVLVIDDQEDAREFLSFTLNMHAAKVTTAGSVAEAMAAIPQCKPDVIISDLGMPDEDGYHLIKKVRALPPDEGGQIPALALTAYADDEHCQSALEAGFQAHLPKPVETSELLTTVARLASQKQSSSACN